MPIHMVNSIDAPDFASETVRIGDLNGDGAPDLLFVQSVYGSRVSVPQAVTLHRARAQRSGTRTRDRVPRPTDMQRRRPS